MSTRELRRVEVFGQIAGGSLRLLDAAEILQLSYRQSKRLWKRYRQEGAGSLQHRSAGRPSNRAKPAAFREKVLQLLRAKYSGSAAERFGPTLAAEHLAEEDGLAGGRVLIPKKAFGCRSPGIFRVRFFVRLPDRRSRPCRDLVGC